MEIRKSLTNYTPREDRVVVQRLERPAPPPGSVIVPTSQAREFQEGIVLAVGPGKRSVFTGQRMPIDLAPGDHVLFFDFAGTEIEVDGVKLISMREEEIHGTRPASNPEAAAQTDLFSGTADAAGIA